MDSALRERPVLHVALGQELEHVQSWYDALFSDLASLAKLENRESVRALVNKERIIQAYPDALLPHERLDDVVHLYADKLEFAPKTILIDGFDWEQGTTVERAAELGAFKIIAKRLGAELWMSAQTHRDVTDAHPSTLTPPCAAYDELIDLAVFLEPEGTHVSVRLLKDGSEPTPKETQLTLDPDTMRLASDAAAEFSTELVSKLRPSAFTLLSGGANGSECAFGEAAERFGVAEIHYSFAGRETARKRGVVELSDQNLERGAVSDVYIKAQLHRSFPKTEKFQRLLKTIWHQVATAGEVFVVGAIQDDGTVKGGTGWGAELARHFHKRLYVFDQEREKWFQWNGDSSSWEAVEPPTIRKTRFTGTGTSALTESGRRAIDGLFERSFGQPSRSRSSG
jgi:hypothetical protein